MRQRDADSAVKHLGRAIELLGRIEKSLGEKDSERFGHTLDAAVLASNGLVTFLNGGHAMDEGHVRLEAYD